MTFLQNGMSILAILVPELIRTALKVYLINRILLFGLSHFFSGTSNYPRVFFRNEQKIFLTTLIIFCSGTLLSTASIVIGGQIIPTQILPFIVWGIAIGQYIFLYIALLKTCFVELITDIWGKYYVSALYTILLAFAMLLLQNIF